MQLYDHRDYSWCFWKRSKLVWTYPDSFHRLGILYCVVCTITQTLYEIEFVFFEWCQTMADYNHAANAAKAVSFLHVFLRGIERIPSLWLGLHGSRRFIGGT